LNLVALFTLLALPSIFGCRPRHGTTRAFYYWRTAFELSEAEKDVLADHHVGRLYLRMFDIGWSGSMNRPVPMGRCVFSHRIPTGIDIVPVVYVANEVFERAASPRELAADAWSLASSLAAKGGFTIRELQVDCDWTDATRAAFFDFCRELRAQGAQDNVWLSATIRLHQVKYRERTGVPPVDRCMLMFYNVGRINPGTGPMSIWNPDDAARYVSHIDHYPLPLDVALAVFTWTIHVQDGRVVGVIGKTDAASLEDCSLLRRTADGAYEAAAPGFFHGTYLRAGDRMLVEGMTPDVALRSAQMLAEHFHPKGDHCLVLFDLDERSLRLYESRDLEDLFSVLG